MVQVARNTEAWVEGFRVREGRERRLEKGGREGGRRRLDRGGRRGGDGWTEGGREGEGG